MKILLLLFGMGLQPTLSHAQSERPDSTTVHAGIDLLKSIFKLIDDPTDPGNKRLIKVDNHSRIITDVGFGCTYYRFHLWGSSTDISISLYRDKIMYYSIQSKKGEDSLFRHILAKEPSLKRRLARINGYGKSDSLYVLDTVIYDEYKRNVASFLGAPVVTYPKKIDTGKTALMRIYSKRYHALLDPFTRYEFGLYCHGSNDAPVGREEPGRPAINYFVYLKDTIAIKSFTRGYNPEGRVYAIFELLLMASRNEYHLTTEDKMFMNKVLDLNITVMACEGCIGWRGSGREAIKYLRGESLLQLLQ